jgi:ABC-type multidrug transport system fused ATPase/permease subunit
MLDYCLRNSLIQQTLKTPRNIILLLVAVALMLLQRALGTYLPFLFGDFVQAVIDDPSAVGLFVQMVITYAVLQFMVQLFSTISDHLADRVQTKFMLGLRKSSFSHLMWHSVSREDNRSGALIELWSRGLTAVDNSIENIVYSIALPIVALVFAFGAVYAALDPILCGIMVVGSMFYVVWLWYFQRFIRPALRKANKLDEQVTEQGLDQLRNRQVFQVFRNSYKLDRQFYAAADEQRDKQLFVQVLRQLWGLGNAAISSVTLGIMLVVAVLLLQQGKLNAGDMATILALSFSMFGPINRINHGIMRLRNNVVSAENLAQRLEEAQSDQEVGAAKQNLQEIQQIDAKQLRIKRGDIIVIDGFDLNVKAGEKVLFRGASGLGKTSVANILAGLDRPANGSVEFETKAGTIYELSDVHPSITYASQDENILNLSIADNIMLGEDDDERLQWAVRKAGLPEKMYERITSGDAIGEAGRNVSGGERKRIMMARALYHMNNVVIFDESLSNLDSETRDAVLDQLLNDEELTLLCISHDDALIDRFDRVVEIADEAIIPPPMASE